MDENNRNYDNQYTDGPSNGPNPSDTWNTPSGSPNGSGPSGPYEIGRAHV